MHGNEIKVVSTWRLIDKCLSKEILLWLQISVLTLQNDKQIHTKDFAADALPEKMEVN